MSNTVEKINDFEEWVRVKNAEGEAKGIYRNKRTHPDNLFDNDRIDDTDEGELDDIVVNDVKLFRMEKMSDGCFWIKLHREKGKDVVFFLNATSDEGKPVKLEGNWSFDGRSFSKE